MKNNEEGASLISALVALGFLGIGAVFVTKNVNFFMKATKNVEQRSELEAIKMSIRSSIDCEETLMAAGLTATPPAASCKSTSMKQLPPYFKLVRRSPFGLHDLTGGNQRADGSYVLGNYYVRSSCSASEGSLVIQAIPTAGKNKLTDAKIDWDTKEALVFGGSGNIPLCFGNNPKIETAQAMLTKTTMTVIEGPSSAFVLVKDKLPLPGDIQPLVGSGFECNKSEGWVVTGCYIHAVSTQGDISPYKNGCLSHDISSSTLTIMCMR